MSCNACIWMTSPVSFKLCRTIGRLLKLPAIAEIDEDIPISDTKVYHRKAGEALSPEREPIAVLESLKLQLGGDTFSAQYQQEPAPPGGAMIKASVDQTLF